MLLLQLYGLRVLSGESETSSQPSSMDPQGGGMPSKEELLEWINSQAGLSDEDRESLLQAILNPLNPGPGPADEEPAYEDPGININAERVLGYLVLWAIAFICVFFGYKLYRSLMDKERKREDKKKIKGQKKKK